MHACGACTGRFWDWHWSPVIAIKIIKKVLTVRCFYFRLRLSFLVSPSPPLPHSLSVSSSLFVALANFLLQWPPFFFGAKAFKMADCAATYATSFCKTRENCPSRSRCSIARDRERKRETGLLMRLRLGLRLSSSQKNNKKRT